MRKIAALIGAALTVLALLVSLSSPAYASDEGNGDRICNYYEICMRYSSADHFDINGSWIHTYYYSSWKHDEEYLWGTVHSLNNFDLSIIVMDNVTGVWNRDSECTVYMWDVSDYGVWSVYGLLGRGGRDNIGFKRNNAHTRCS